MLKKLIVFSVLVTAAIPAYAYKVQTFTPAQTLAPLQPLLPPQTIQQPQTIAPVQTIAPEQVQSQYQSNGQYETYPKISQLENVIFQKTYENQDIYLRLGRLEKKLFRRTFDNMALSDRMDNILNNIDPAIVYNINTKELAKIETKILGRSFEGETIDERIIRLEKEMLGAMQGGNIKQRYEVVKSASRHYNAYPTYTAGGTPQNNYTMYNNYKKPRRNILGFLFDMMSTGFGAGAMTGYTPPVFSPFDNFQDASGIQDYYMGNRGGYYNNRNIGNGSSVRILD